MIGSISRVLVAALVVLAAAEGRSAIVHRYLFEDGAGTTVVDSVGTDHGTIRNQGGTGSWTTGRFGGAWDGTASGFVSVPSGGVATNRGSFVQWVEIATTAGDYSNPLTSHIIDPDYSPYPMRIEPQSNGNAQFYGIPNGTTGYHNIVTTSPIRDNTWHQLVLTYDQAANTAVAYIDGRRVGSSGYNPTGVNLNPTWLMGARFESGSGRCSAVYDNAAVYDHALNAGEVWDLYQVATDGVTTRNGSPVAQGPGPRHYYAFNATGRPASDVEVDLRSGYDALVRGGTWASDSPPQNSGGWRKTTANDEVYLPMAIDLAQGTYEGWFKSEATSGDWSNPLATAIRDVNEVHAADSMRIEVTASNTYVYDAPGAGSLTTNVDTTDGAWHLLTLTYAHGERVKLYIDGVLRGQTGSNYDVAKATDRGYDILGMRSIGNGGGWRGTVGTLAYFDRVLSDAEILGHFQSGIPVPEPSGFVLAALGLLGIAACRRRRRSEPVNELGQAPGNHALSPGFDDSRSEPVPSFHRLSA